MKKTFAIALVMMLLAASFSFAENFEKENALPAIPSEPTNEGLSQDEAVGIVKQKMADAYQRPLSDFDCHKVKANFVALENGEDAWVVMVDHNNENYDVGAAAIIDPQDGTILNYVSNEERAQSRASGAMEKAKRRSVHMDSRRAGFVRLAVWDGRNLCVSI